MSASRVQIVNQTSFLPMINLFSALTKKTQKMNVLVVAFFLMKSHFNLTTIIIIDCICGVCLVAMMELQMILPGSGV